VPALTLISLGLCLGGLFAWAATSDLRQRADTLQSRAAWVVALYSLLVWSPCIGLLLSFHADWSFSYLVAAQELPTGALAAWMLLTAAMSFLGFSSAASLARQRRVTPLLLAGGAILVLCLIAALLTVPRLLVVGSTLQFDNQFGLRNIAGSGLGYMLLHCASVTAVASVWTLGALRRTHSAASPAASSALPHSIAGISGSAISAVGLSARPSRTGPPNGRNHHDEH
jgi:hypothetical protein